MIKIIFLIYVYITLKIILDKDPFEYVIEFYEKNKKNINLSLISKENF